ncbi:MAG TPA: GYD domain-containing protein [Candidatus Limnocylindrales bacterium]|nr:GYD domain-containing protein [Candidatus Limnocylindrales bacterium]
MPLFLTQVAYTQEAWQSLIGNPQNRIDAIRPAIEKLGGKVISGYFCFGDYDIVAITEMPDNVAAAAIAIAFAAGGACKSVRTTPLMTTAEGIDALKKAAGSGYKPVKAARAAGGR